MRYRIEYSSVAERHIAVLISRQQRIIVNAIERQLAFLPTKATRNRKPMNPNPIAPWELRVGDLRVYYDVLDPPEAVVPVLAVGVKRHNRVFIGDEEIQL